MIKFHYFHKSFYTEIRMGKKVLITGSTDGIGREAARTLASRGYDLVIHGRSLQRVNNIVEEIRKTWPDIQCEGVTADFSSLTAVKKMAGEIIQNHRKIDILINNAGIIVHTFLRSENGYEMTFAVNHLAHFFLTLLLLDHLREPARILNVSSMVHATSIDFDRLNDPQFFEGVNAYALSKLCNVLFTYKLDRLLRGKKKITVNCFHPGVINTKVLTHTWGNIGATVSEGSRMPVYLATSPEVENISGAYFQDSRQRRSAAISHDTNVQDACWNRSIEMLRKAGFSANSKIEITKPK